MKFLAQRVDFMMSCEMLWLAENGQPVKPVDLYVDHSHEKGTIAPATIRMNDADARRLFMSLWEAGYRPPHEQNVDAVVKAKDKHIEFAESVTNSLLGR